MVEADKVLGSIGRCELHFGYVCRMLWARPNVPNLRKCSGVFGNVPIFLITENLNSFENGPKFSKLARNFRNFLKLFENGAKFLKLIPNFQNRPNLSKIINYFEKMARNFRKWPRIFDDCPKKLPKIVRKCVQRAWDFTKCQNICKHGPKPSKMPQF